LPKQGFFVEKPGPKQAAHTLNAQFSAADNFRASRRRGITPRKTIDMVIGAHCIVHRLRLLHADRDFDVLEKELGLLVLKV
jgi:predicted nucleic acid-binding protein